MSEALVGLDNLTTVIRTESDTLAAFVVSSTYSPATALDDANGTEVDDLDSPTLLRGNKGKVAVEKIPPGAWTVTVGSEQAWWGVSLDGESVQQLLDRFSHILECEADRSSLEALARKIRHAFSQQLMLFGVPRSWSRDASSWASIRLYFDPQTDPIYLDLTRLSSDVALAHSTRILLSAQPTSPRSIMPAFELSQVQRKLTATQQALREERHKYRSLLAAPSAAGGRHGRRPVVGLGSSQRSSAAPTSSPSSGSRSYGREATAPSSDDLSVVSTDSRASGSRGWQRTLSLVNPTRVQRADPSQNDDFVGDGDDTLDFGS